MFDRPCPTKNSLKFRCRSARKVRDREKIMTPLTPALCPRDGERETFDSPRQPRALRVELLERRLERGEPRALLLDDGRRRGRGQTGVRAARERLPTRLRVMSARSLHVSS